MGVAANLESLGKNDEALSTYQRLATEYPQSFNAPLALLAEVPFLKAKDRIDDARRVCETIMSPISRQHCDERSDAGDDVLAEARSTARPCGRACASAAIPMARPPGTGCTAAAPSAKP